MAAFLLVGVFAWRERWVTTVPDVDALRSWGTRLLGTSFVVAALYAGYLMAQGYGTDSLFYSMPWSNPAAFAKRLIVLVTTGGVALVSPLSTDMMTMFPQVTLPFVLIATPITLALTVWTWRTVRGHPAAASWPCGSR